MQGFSKKSQEIIDYRKEHTHYSLETVAGKFGKTKQWVSDLCKRAGIPTAAVPYEGMVLYVRNVPEDIVQSVKLRARGEGLTMRIKIIELMENYGKGIDKQAR
jgi:hypothetical protein